jgi:hypothetical protein
MQFEHSYAPPAFHKKEEKRGLQIRKEKKKGRTVFVKKTLKIADMWIFLGYRCPFVKETA